ncbi:MAG TPA: hypothetical protein VMA98_07705 [Candidatus Acidoferrales bacterium]|nr:hypothetical protein [Candidatus Acidoferrales bacterium]
MEQRYGLALTAAIFSAAAALGGLWSGYEAHRSADLSNQGLNIEASVAIVRYCDVDSRDRMESGDDIDELTGSSGGEEYTTNMERRELLNEVSQRPRRFLSCKLTNYGRVPVLDITYFETVTYHGGNTHKRQHNNEVIDAIGPGESRTFWVVNTDNDPLVFHVPDLVTYYRFPDLNRLREQTLSLDSHDYWILRRSADPAEHYE